MNKQIERDYYKQKRDNGDLLFPFQRSPIKPLSGADPKRWQLAIVGLLLLTLAALACVSMVIIGG
jgi:hypothetical protein